jgi:threonine aldolase
MFTDEQVINSINPPDFYHSPKTSLVCVENTTNKGGGACWDINELTKIHKTCKEHNLFYHLDGARIWNAMVKTNTKPIQYGKIFDSISICLSKGLGCPVGSVLLGSNEFINKAIRIRKVLGGGMRQAGYLAACGIYALNNNVDRLKEDHLKALEIEKLLSKQPYIKKVEEVETNILIFQLKSNYDSNIFLKKMLESGIKLISMGDNKLRIVTHKDYSDKMHLNFIEIIRNLQI